MMPDSTGAPAAALSRDPVAGPTLAGSTGSRAPRWLRAVGWALGIALSHQLLEAAAFQPAPQRFHQEVAEHSRLSAGWPTGPIQLIDLASDGSPRVFARGRWRERRPAGWTELADLTPQSEREFRFPDAAGQPVTVAIPWAEVRQLVRAPEGVWLITAQGPQQVRAGQLLGSGWGQRGPAHQLALGSDGQVVVAAAGGLVRRVDDRWEAIEVLDSQGRAWAVRDVLGVTFDSAGRLWFGTKAGVGVGDGSSWRFYEGKDGLPWNDFTALAAGPDGQVWFGTRLGAVGWDGREFHYRQGLRWLPHDEIQGLAVDREGRVWFATADGVGSIGRRPTTLAEKAAYYEEEIARYIKRTPFGYTAEAPLRQPANKASANPHDSDNDGLWTAMYGAGECFAYGATRDAQARTRARQAFEALRFLQQVTQGGSHTPPKGYVARTIRPIEWPDPNEGRLARDLAEQKDDRLWKAYEPRWPKSADGKWYWKSDTSSDELDGHYFFYPLYFDLVADSDAEKNRVREVVRDLTDHLVAHDFTLTDIDGKPTRWAIYGPRALNHDPDWWPERGLKSLSILSYLAAAAHITGDAKYHEVARDLVRRHGYAQNLMFPKVQFGPGSGNQSDDEMAVMCFYNLLKYGRDEEIMDRVRYSFFAYWAVEANEMNPFFNFAYAAHGLDQRITNTWGVYPVSPWSGWHADAMATLYGFPLDRLDWSHRNSHRLDLVRFGQMKAKDLYQPERSPRGHRVNGKVLPVENRHFNHWNTDPWDLDYGGNGSVLASGTVFLLPYYMGLYHGYIAKP